MTSSLQKKNRLRSKENLDYIKSLPCFVCGASAPSDPDHFKTKGAGGGDDMSNLNPLCRTHHIQRHSMGIKSFWDRYNVVILANREKYDLPPLDIKFQFD